MRTSVNHSLNRVQLGITFCQYDAWQTGLPSAPRRAATRPVCTWFRLGLGLGLGLGLWGRGWR